MRHARFSSAIFMVVFSFAYAFAFAMNWPMFLYYPLHGDFNWGPRLNSGLGPGIAWYGLMASAGAVAAAAAVLLPDRAIPRMLRNYLWVFPCGAILTCAYLLRLLFV